MAFLAMRDMPYIIVHVFTCFHGNTVKGNNFYYRRNDDTVSVFLFDGNSIDYFSWFKILSDYGWTFLKYSSYIDAVLTVEYFGCTLEIFPNAWGFQNSDINNAIASK